MMPRGTFARLFETLPIIGLSAHAMQGDVDRARAAGFTDYLTKPVDEDLLFKKLAEYLGRMSHGKTKNTHR